MKVTLVRKRECFGGKCFIIDEDEKRKKKLGQGGIIISIKGIIINIKVIKGDVLGGQYSIEEDENRLKMLLLLATLM